jgi:hypothetical protein
MQTIVLELQDRLVNFEQRDTDMKRRVAHLYGKLNAINAPKQ